MKKLICIAMIGTLVGCAGYEFGDGTKVMLKTKTVYCNVLPEKIRQATLQKMQSMISSYPKHSICDMRGFIVDIVKPLD